MLFKLSIRNMKKSFKDYAIYFLTLVLGVAIFYMFNSLDSQQAMLEVSQSTRDMIQLLVQMLGMLSVFINGHLNTVWETILKLLNHNMQI